MDKMIVQQVEVITITETKWKIIGYLDVAQNGISNKDDPTDNNTKFIENFDMKNM